MTGHFCSVALAPERPNHEDRPDDTVAGGSQGAHGDALHTRILVVPRSNTAPQGGLSVVVQTTNTCGSWPREG